jgi:hypothetical protein
MYIILRIQKTQPRRDKRKEKNKGGSRAGIDRINLTGNLTDQIECVTETVTF